MKRTGSFNRIHICAKFYPYIRLPLARLSYLSCPIDEIFILPWCKDPHRGGSMLPQSLPAQYQIRQQDRQSPHLCGDYANSNLEKDLVPLGLLPFAIRFSDQSHQYPRRGTTCHQPVRQQVRATPGSLVMSGLWTHEYAVFNW